jgi:hypothetical protein
MGKMQVSALKKVLYPIHHVVQSHKIEAISRQGRRATVQVLGVTEDG